MAYTIEITAAARRALKKLTADVAQEIADAINDLQTVPRPAGVKKLTAESDLYRIRTGDYRIIYQIEDKRLVLLVVAIGHRRDVYRRR